MFPQKHSFSYSYLFVGVPIGYQGSSGSLLSAESGILPDEDKKTKHIPKTKSWFRVEAADYLSRGNTLGLEGNLHAYLKSQNEDPTNYPHAYLVTAPRFLGYSFNPVSFWYLYSGQGKLAAMILEVNNTFDEKRIYFLKSQENEHFRLQLDRGDGIIKELNAGTDSPKAGNSQNEIESVPLPKDEPVQSSSADFRTTWTKDFHVSPFNSRKGNYALSAHDPFSPFMSGNGAISNTITLTSSKNHAKLIARVFSTQPSLDPSSLGLIEKIRLVAGWWWVGYVTFPRILREAAKLFFRRKLHVWFRPEVLKGSIGRRETHDENILEQCFRAFLQFQVEHSDLDLAVKYIPAFSAASHIQTFLSRSFKSTLKPEPAGCITLEITSPLFYTLFVRNPSPLQFFASAFTLPTKQPHTVHVSHPDLFLTLFASSTLSTLPSSSQPSLQTKSQPYSNLTWSLISWLRSLSITSKHTNETQSPFDTFIKQNLSPPLTQKYRTALLKLLLGNPILIDVLINVLKILLCYIYAGGIIELLFRAENSRSFQGAGAVRGWGGWESERWWWGLLALRLIGLHAWWVLGRCL